MPLLLLAVFGRAYHGTLNGIYPASLGARSGVAGSIIFGGRLGSYSVAGFNHIQWPGWAGLRSDVGVNEKVRAGYPVYRTKIHRMMRRRRGSLDSTERDCCSMHCRCSSPRGSRHELPAGRLYMNNDSYHIDIITYYDHVRSTLEFYGLSECVLPALFTTAIRRVSLRCGAHTFARTLAMSLDSSTSLIESI